MTVSAEAIQAARDAFREVIRANNGGDAERVATAAWTAAIEAAWRCEPLFAKGEFA